VLTHAPDELTRARLHRLGESVGKVVYASEHCVVKRERSPSEVVVLIVVWKGLRTLSHWLPRRWSERLLERPSREIGFLRVSQRVIFPPTRVRVDGWPGWLMVHEATERLESTLHLRLLDLAANGRFDELEQWLDRLLELRQSGWRRGLFSLDTHLKNFGIRGENIVLLHRQLGLGSALREQPELAARFNARWKAIVNREHVLLQWLGDL
jgi:hypothetical protein